jgi:hypothetical protein
VKRRQTRSRILVQLKAGTMAFTYIPLVAGEHTVDIMHGNVKLLSSPVIINDLKVKVVRDVPKYGVQADVLRSVVVDLYDAQTKNRYYEVFILFSPNYSFSFFFFSFFFLVSCFLFLVSSPLK